MEHNQIDYLSFSLNIRYGYGIFKNRLNEKVCLQACFSFRKRLYMHGLSKFTYSVICVMNKAMLRLWVFQKAEKHLCKRLVHRLNLFKGNTIKPIHVAEEIYRVLAIKKYLFQPQKSWSNVDGAQRNLGQIQDISICSQFLLH